MQVGRFEMESPMMNAGGVVKTVEDVRAMAQTGVGAVLAGSYTLEPRIGNSPDGEVVYHHDQETGITYNSLGMPNQGMEAVAQDLPEMIDIAHRHGKPLILNFAPVSEAPDEEVLAAFDIMAEADVDIDELDGFELNAGCPNVVTEDGGRHELLSHHMEPLRLTLLELNDIVSDELPALSLILRISPFRTVEDANALVKLLEDVPVDVVSAFNTFTGGEPKDDDGNHILQVPGGIGGQSGPGKAAEAEEQTKWLVDAQNRQGIDFDIIGSNGVLDARSMSRRLELGANAVSLTTLFYESPSWASAVDGLLSSYADLSP